MRIRRAASSRSAFTMIEIAISLAVIAFALVAIIGVLPTGMRVQKDNRQETIINQDASVFLEALRNGAYGADDLTNYVAAITNVSVVYDRSQPPREINRAVMWYTTTNSSMNPQIPLTNGYRIVGLLSTPKYMPLFQANGRYNGFISNYNIAIVRSISGPASEKLPQNNPDVLQLALSYRMISEVVPYGTNHYDATWTNVYDPMLYNPTNFAEISARSNYLALANTLQTNLHDLRLIFRWPVFEDGTVGDGRQVFRTMVGGRLLATNDVVGWPLYFLEPRNYVRAR